MASVIKKPTLNTDAALDFAEGRKPVTRKKSRAKKWPGYQLKNPYPSPGWCQRGDVWLTANIRGDLHLKLKIEAAQKRTTIGELIEKHIR